MTVRERVAEIDAQLLYTKETAVYTLSNLFINSVTITETKNDVAKYQSPDFDYVIYNRGGNNYCIGNKRTGYFSLQQCVDVLMRNHVDKVVMKRTKTTI